MTRQKIVDEIALNIDGLVGVQAQNRADRVYEMALYKLGRLPLIPWNKAEETITLSSGTAVYSIPDDILTDYSTNQVCGIMELWRTDSQGREVNIVDRNYFNSYKRGSTATGAPLLAMQYWDDDMLKLGFYYTPDDDYSLWAYIRKNLVLGDIPDEYHDTVVYRGIMLANKGDSPAYEKAKDLYLESIQDIKGADLTVWGGGLIKPSVVYGHHGQGRMNVDSQNYYGLV